jgi:hypothetical protein
MREREGERGRKGAGGRATAAHGAECCGTVATAPCRWTHLASTLQDGLHDAHDPHEAHTSSGRAPHSGVTRSNTTARPSIQTLKHKGRTDAVTAERRRRKSARRELTTPLVRLHLPRPAHPIRSAARLPRSHRRRDHGRGHQRDAMAAGPHTPRQAAPRRRHSQQYTPHATHVQRQQATAQRGKPAP